MGIPIQSWRVRIGLYGHGSYKVHSPGAHCPQEFCVLLRLLVIIAALLVIGNIELNPGPVYKCFRCDSTSSDLYENAAHQKIHSNCHNFVFVCAWPTCNHQVSTYKGLTSHLDRVKHEVRKDLPLQHHREESPSFKCNAKNCMQCLPSLAELCHHIIGSHFHKETGTSTCEVKCPFPDCDRNLPFPSKKSFYSHLGQSHKEWRNLVPSQSSRPVENVSFREEMEVGESSQTEGVEKYVREEDDGVMLSGNPHGDKLNSDEVDYRFIAQFYLLLEGMLLLPSSTVQKISEQLTIVSEVVHRKIRSTLINELQQCGLSEEDIQNVSSKVLAADPLYSTHHRDCSGPSLTSEYYRNDYYRKNFLYIEPKEYFPSEDRVGAKAVQYVPIEDTLKMLLRDPSVQQQIIESFSEERESSNLYQNYTDGQVCINKNSHIKKRIDLLIFTDGFSVTNPLGSAKTKHRLEGTYFTLGNLKPHTRSKLDFIHLISMISKDLLKEHGYEKCYKPLMTDLKKLEEEGIDFLGEKIPVLLMFVIGDNLGQHQLGGFVESFSSNYFCRFCTITKKEFKEDPTNRKSFRTPSHYDSCVKKVRSCHLPSFKGVKFSSVINFLKNTHVCDPRLAVCIAHDLFHGVVSWDLSAFIKYFVETKNWFTYELLNKRIANFQCRDGDGSNKPAAVHTSGLKLGGHAVQNWTLLRLFPFILQDLIKDPSDRVWNLYLNLKTLCELICAPVISVDQVNLLREKIYNYMRSAQDFVKFRPKHHFVTHYPDLFSFFGPLIHLATLRFESKHSFFKRIIRATNNFINVPRTLILRHQLHLAYLSSGDLLNTSVVAKKCRELDASEYDVNVWDAIKMQCFCNAQACDSVNVGDLSYKTGQWLITESFSDSSLEVGCIKAIILTGSVVHFVLLKHMASHSSSYGIFEIDESSSSISCLKQSDLKYPSIQPVYDFMGNLCISLKNVLN